MDRKWLAVALLPTVGFVAAPAAGADRPQAVVARVIPPRTVYQCKKMYKRGSKARAACIKQVGQIREPGSDPFAVPGCLLLSSQTVDSSHSGDTKDFTVSLTAIRVRRQLIYRVTVTVHNPRVVICDAALGFQPHHQGPVYFPAQIPPGGGTSQTITRPDTDLVFAVAHGRRIS